MKNNNKIVWDIYGVLLDLKLTYDTSDINIDFDKYVELEMKGLIKEATEWLVEDEEEKKLSL